MREAVAGPTLQDVHALGYVSRGKYVVYVKVIYFIEFCTNENAMGEIMHNLFNYLLYNVALHFISKGPGAIML